MLRYYFYHQDKDIESIEKDVIIFIPETERNLLFQYFNNEKDFNSYEYTRISRAIYTFAFLHPNIKMEKLCLKMY